MQGKGDWHGFRAERNKVPSVWRGALCSCPAASDVVEDDDLNVTRRDEASTRGVVTRTGGLEGGREREREREFEMR